MIRILLACFVVCLSESVSFGQPDDLYCVYLAPCQVEKVINCPVPLGYEKASCLSHRKSCNPGLPYNLGQCNTTYEIKLANETIKSFDAAPVGEPGFSRICFSRRADSLLGENGLRGLQGVDQSIN